VPVEPLDCPVPSCRRFESAEEALKSVLVLEPNVLALGETHSLARHEGLASTAERVRKNLLSSLVGFRALVIEVVLPPAGCQREEQAVRDKTAAVTETQKQSNQSDFLALANSAKEAGITPYPLRLDCDDLEQLQNAEDTVSLMLEWIRDKTVARVLELHAAGATPVLVYGGAMHNDAAPRPGAEAFSIFAPLSEKLEVVELDLMGREFIEDRPPYNRLPWFAAYRQACSTPGALLFENSKHSYALILPWQSDSRECPPLTSATP
jgi:hypothetical protein